MNIFSIFLIAVGLAMDAFAVSIACGVSIKNLRIRHILAIASAFGFFQGIMPLIGWCAGIGFRDRISAIDHWLAFGLLFFIGAKMISESFTMENAESEVEAADVPLNASRLLILSLATSIDALAVGLSFSCLQVAVMTPALIIGLVTMVLSMAGVVIGDRIGHLFEGRIELVGGFILIAIGVKIL